MGIRVSTAAGPVIPKGLGCVIYDQDGINTVHHIDSRSLHSQRGGKHVNQDSAVLCEGYGGDYTVFCGVFDGHGRNGHLVSKTLRHRLSLLLLEQKSAVSEVNLNYPESQSASYRDASPNSKELLEWNEAYMNAFQIMEEELKMVKKADYSFNGSTAVVAVKQGNDLLIANLRDSRAILGTKEANGVTAVQLTIAKFAECFEMVPRTLAEKPC